MTAVIARIVLRYLAGLLVMKGLLSADLGKTFAGDVEIAGLMELGLGALAGLAAEWWYWLARRLGWAK